MKDDLNIQDLVNRKVYVDKILVGEITGERFHPDLTMVQSMRMKVAPGVAEEYMRKPANQAPLPKELVHSIKDDGSIKLSKSMRELQRRWRNTIRIGEQIYAPDELLDRAIFDSQNREIGVVIELSKVKRTYRGVSVCVKPATMREFGLPEIIKIPVTSLARLRDRMDDIILSRPLEKQLQLPSQIQMNSAEWEEE